MFLFICHKILSCSKPPKKIQSIRRVDVLAIMLRHEKHLSHVRGMEEKWALKLLWRFIIVTLSINLHEGRYYRDHYLSDIKNH